MSRLTTPDEVDAYAERAGLTPAGRYGDWGGSPLLTARRRMVKLHP